MKIGEVARATRVSRSAIRYYEAVGILPPIARRNGVRLYEPESVDELKALRFYRASGISISRLVAITKQPRGSQSRHDIWVEVLQARIAELESIMKEAGRMREMLKESLACRCAGKRDDCVVLKAADA